jgi:hypothetical protein
MAKTLNDLKKEWKTRLNESYAGATVDEDGGSAPAHDDGTEVKPVEKAGKTDGVGDSAPTEFAPSNGEGDLSGNTKSVDREAGSAAGRAESGDGDKEGSDSAVDGANPVPRADGAEGAPKEWNGSLGDFRNQVRGTLGLPLNDPKNQGNDGLNKDGKDGDVKQNVG